jgi:hypothetical protein
VLKFLERVRFWREAQKAAIELGRRVYGRARDPHHKECPEEPGEIAPFQTARKDLVFAIVQARYLHYAMTHAYDPGIACALQHLEAALNCLKQWPEIEVDPTLPRRTPGRKPEMKFAFREEEPPRRVIRRDLKRALRDLLLSLHLRCSRPQANSLASKLLDPILQ